MIPPEVTALAGTAVVDGADGEEDEDEGDVVVVVVPGGDGAPGAVSAAIVVRFLVASIEPRQNVLVLALHAAARRRREEDGELVHLSILNSSRWTTHACRA
jgi:hypothetical protein